MLPNSQPPCDRLSEAEPPVALPRIVALRERDARFKAMKNLVGEIAHTFNNSLAPLAGYTTLLAEDMKPGTPSEQYLGKLEAALRKAESFVETILQATHPERHFLPKRVDLTYLLQQTIDAWMKSLPVSAQISVETRVVPCVLWLDEAQWTQAIQHLLKNAQFALTGGGTLRLTLEERVLTPARAAELDLTQTEVVQLTIEDTGCGMPPEVLERACEPLYTTRPQTPVSGLGLTLVHSIVQLHGGQLEIESTEQTGTTLRAWLPAEPR
jgi:signal transduction histidine kinase